MNNLPAPIQRALAPFAPSSLPGVGDEATWGACTGHPNDPRTDHDAAADVEDGIEKEINCPEYLVELLCAADSDFWQQIYAERVKPEGQRDLLEMGRLLDQEITLQAEIEVRRIYALRAA